MGFSCGIVGLPNAGKSTIFNALTASCVPAESYPFCTIEPHQGTVAVPDPRLAHIAEIIHPEKVTPTLLEFIDIAGLVRDAHKGEGLGNQFLEHIRRVDAVAHVVRVFSDPEVSHGGGNEVPNPAEDTEIINTELLLADLLVIERRIEKVGKEAKSGNKEKMNEKEHLELVREVLAQGKPVRAYLPPSRDNEAKEFIRDLNLITARPVIYILNLGEEWAGRERAKIEEIERIIPETAEVVPVFGKVEAEVSELPVEERNEFLKEMGIGKSGLEQIIQAGYRTLDLITFYTTTGPELRAWTIKRGTRAPRAAGKIHTDFEKGFIKAEVAHYDDFESLGNLHAVKEAGKLHIEGKEYEVKDGDIVYFRFNV